MGGGSCASAPGGGPAQATTVDGSSTETMVSVAGLEQYAHKIVSSSIRNYVQLYTCKADLHMIILRQFLYSKSPFRS